MSSSIEKVSNDFLRPRCAPGARLAARHRRAGLGGPKWDGSWSGTVVARAAKKLVVREKGRHAWRCDVDDTAGAVLVFLKEGRVHVVPLLVLRLTEVVLERSLLPSVLDGWKRRTERKRRVTSELALVRAELAARHDPSRASKGS